VLVMERFYGHRVDDLAAIQRMGVDAEAKLVDGMLAWFRCVLFHGFFHGDVHAGNLMILDTQEMGFLDFGIVGRFDDNQRQNVTEYMAAFASADYKRLALIISKMGALSPESDLDAFAIALEQIYKPLLTIDFADVNYSEFLPEINRVAREHKMSMPNELILMTKQMLYFDRYAKLLAPQLSVFSDPRLIMSLMKDMQKSKAQTPSAKALMV
jgi:predicted unusual protein kinase regulating ubiquinone biosynthesis (AarF/ABC1/UbiB family)